MTATALSRRVKKTSRTVAGGLALTVALLAPTLALAKSSDRDQPMNFESKSSEIYNKPNSMSTLTSNVKITQGTLLVTGDLANIFTDADTQVARVLVFGKTKLAHIQQLDDNDQLMTGDGDKIDYNKAQNLAIITGHAVVHQPGRGEFHGEKITYNTATAMIVGEAAAGGLVHGVFLPKPKPAATPAAPAKSAPAATKPATAPAGTPASAPSTAKPAASTP